MLEFKQTKEFEIEVYDNGTKIGYLEKYNGLWFFEIFPTEKIHCCLCSEKLTQLQEKIYLLETLSREGCARHV